MKKSFLISLAIVFSAISHAAECPVTSSAEGPVSYYGKLQVRAGTPFIDGVKGGKINKRLVQVRGVSFGWSNPTWESGRFYNANAVERIVKDWKAEIVRAAYGTTNVNADNASNRERIKTIVKAAIENDIYVIIDWHSHNAHTETNQSKNFFEEMAQIYGGCDGVIFELYNEPTAANGGTWAAIKTYAEEIIPVIREHSDNLILVGTPEWSQRVEHVINDAIDDVNIGYVLHFYSASHFLTSWRSNIDNAIISNLPIFVTEYGTTTSDGGQNNNYNSHNSIRTDEWHNYMDSKRMSSVAWNINDKCEGSAFFGVQPSCAFDQNLPTNWTDTTKMTESGKYVFKKLNSYYLSAPWNPNAVPALPVEGKLSFGFEFLGGKKLSVSLPQSGHAVLEIFSLQGKKMGSLLQGYQNAGNLEVSFADLNLKRGVYIVNLRSNSAAKTKVLRIIR